MKINDDIIRYCDGQMTGSQKSAFELEIKSSPELQAQLEEYRENIEKLKFTGSPEIDHTYFNTTIPKVREKLERKKTRKLSPRLAFVVTVIAAFIIALNIFSDKSLNSDRPSVTEVITDTLSNDEINSILSYYSNPDLALTSDNYDELTDDLQDEALLDHINISDEGAEEYLTKNNGITELYALVSDDEAEAIYNELKNKKFF